MRLNDAARELIGNGCDATMVTLNPDGSPQVSLVWVAWRESADGDDIVVGHLSKTGNRKVRNIRHDPRVALNIVKPGVPAQPISLWMSVSGTATVVEGGAPELLSELAAVLTPGVDFVPEGAPAGFVTRIRVEQVGGVGPWAATA
jgi:PPOX class probable F420-dependent enzyme